MHLKLIGLCFTAEDEADQNEIKEQKVKQSKGKERGRPHKLIENFIVLQQEKQFLV